MPYRRTVQHINRAVTFAANCAQPATRLRRLRLQIRFRIRFGILDSLIRILPRITRMSRMIDGDGSNVGRTLDTYQKNRSRRGMPLANRDAKENRGPRRETLSVQM